MKLVAELTTGWTDDPLSEFSALMLAEKGISEEGRGRDEFIATLRSNPDQPILCLDALFRRHTSGFDSVKTFVGALSLMADIEESTGLRRCRIDLFAWSFLQGAKNIDFLLPITAESCAEVYPVLADWTSTLIALENFERSGEALPGLCSVSADDYLSIRRIVTRASTRDELRTLAALMISGPSTSAQLIEELGLNVALCQRILAALINIDVVELREVDRANHPVYKIQQSALPLVIFCLREKLGMDMLKPVLSEIDT